MNLKQILLVCITLILLSSVCYGIEYTRDDPRFYLKEKSFQDRLFDIYESCRLSNWTNEEKVFEQFGKTIYFACNEKSHLGARNNPYPNISIPSYPNLGFESTSMNIFEGTLFFSIPTFYSVFEKKNIPVNRYKPFIYGVYIHELSHFATTFTESHTESSNNNPKQYTQIEFYKNLLKENYNIEIDYGITGMDFINFDFFKSINYEIEFPTLSSGELHYIDPDRWATNSTYSLDEEFVQEEISRINQFCLEENLNISNENFEYLKVKDTVFCNRFNLNKTNLEIVNLENFYKIYSKILFTQEQTPEKGTYKLQKAEIILSNNIINIESSLPPGYRYLIILGMLGTIIILSLYLVYRLVWTIYKKIKKIAI